MYACTNVLTKLMYFQQLLYVLGVKQYYGYGYQPLYYIDRYICYPLLDPFLRPVLCLAVCGSPSRVLSSTHLFSEMFH